MVEKTLTIVNPSGLHARPATQVVDYVKNYPGTVEVLMGEKKGNLKSILNVLSLGLVQGAEITLRVDGEDDEAFIEKLAAFIQNLDG